MFPHARVIAIVAVLGLATALVPETRLHAQQEPTPAEVAETRTSAEQGNVGAQVELGKRYAGQIGPSGTIYGSNR